MAFPAGSTDINDLAATVAQQAEQIRILQAQVNGLLSRIDPVTGELKNVAVGFVRFDRDGIEMTVDHSDLIPKEATIKFIDRFTGGRFGTIGTYYNPNNELVSFDILANMDHEHKAFTHNGSFELVTGAQSTATSSAHQSLWITTWNHETSTYAELFELSYTRQSSITPAGSSIGHDAFLVRWCKPSSYVVVRIDGKPTADHPGNAEEGMWYWSKNSSGMYLYANADWRTISSW